MRILISTNSAGDGEMAATNAPTQALDMKRFKYPLKNYPFFTRLTRDAGSPALKGFTASIFLLFGLSSTVLSQKNQIDTLFIQSFPGRYAATSYVSLETIEIVIDGTVYKPNIPLNAGLGLSVKNTVINFAYDFGLIPLHGDRFGETRVFNAQIHHFGKSLVFDLFFQKYKGFYQAARYNDKPLVYPNMAVRQIGAEASFFLNGNRFSTKAGFQGSKRQIRSAGSFIIGGGVYHYQTTTGSEPTDWSSEPAVNWQVGLNSGYAKNWVMSTHWLISGAVKLGINAVKTLNRQDDDKIQLYPAAYTRAGAAYQTTRTGIDFQMLIFNRSVYSNRSRQNLGLLDFQLSYTIRF